MTDVADVSVQPLLDYFNRLIPLSTEEKELIKSKFHSHLFLKKQFALQHGDVCEYFNFVVRGCMRLYMVDDKGVYHILQFATENYWILDLTSFHKKFPAKLNIDALEDTVVLRITHSDLLDLYIRAPKFDRIFRVLLENHFMLQQQRMVQLFSSTAEERYQLFLETYPHLLNRLSQVQIAAYLGVTPEFLSRIRSRMAKSDK
ncbi:MAG: Crp/Fnr family transcriptional regulator [Cyclobacteriaceae bacterium]|jgi:CRP-like cAMP-binding protein|nr:Crp/Fnr family transcriptional regulator [Cyclobacteriaceae bacterium]